MPVPAAFISRPNAQNCSIIVGAWSISRARERQVDLPRNPRAVNRQDSHRFYVVERDVAPEAFFRSPEPQHTVSAVEFHPLPAPGHHPKPDQEHTDDAQEDHGDNRVEGITGG